MSMELMTMETLFEKAGFDYRLMEKNIPYDVSDKKIKIKSFNHETKTIEMKPVNFLNRKYDVIGDPLVTKEGDLLLKSSGDHRIYDAETESYVKVKEIEKGYALNNNQEKIEFFVKETNEIYPIVDLHVEDNENYFSNGILSHNTGGNALKFYVSIRLKLKKIGAQESGTGEDKLDRKSVV